MPQPQCWGCTETCARLNSAAKLACASHPLCCLQSCGHTQGSQQRDLAAVHQRSKDQWFRRKVLGACGPGHGVAWFVCYNIRQWWGKHLLRGCTCPLKP